MLENKKLLLAAGQTPAVAWLKARYPEADIQTEISDGWLPDVVVAVRKSRIGGVEDPVKILEEVLARGGLPVTVIVAGKKDREGKNIARRAGALGIQEEFILFADEGGITAPAIARVLEDAVGKDARPAPLVYYESDGNENENPEGASLQANEKDRGRDSERTTGRAGEEYWPSPGEPAPAAGQVAEEDIDWSPLAPYKELIITMVSPCAGVGKTTLVAALAAYLTSQGEQVAVIDLETPPMAMLHMGNTSLEHQGNWRYATTPWGELWLPVRYNPVELRSLLTSLARNGYRVLIDAANLPVPWGTFSRQVEVIGGDLRVLYVRKQQANVENGVLVANRVPATSLSIWPSVVEDVLGQEPQIVILEDQEGCQATVANMTPAIVSPGSDAIAAGIGNLAALLWPERGES
ncbi:MAG: cellulose synthase operon protein YhjQ/BcsQ [Moorellaceae bacterium]